MKRVDAILEYVKANRPDCYNNIKSVLDNFGRSSQLDAMCLVMFLSFEAGRVFQDDTKTELNNPNIYLKGE